MIALALLACGAPPEPVLAPEPVAAPPPAPLVWPADLHAPLPCAPACAREEAARAAVERGARWLAANTGPEAELKKDVAIGWAQLRPRWRSELIEREFARSVARLDSGGDPRRRLWDETARLPPEARKWNTVAGQKLIPNIALVEALYCQERGFEPEVTTWLCKEQRDGGGRVSAHAAWFLALAVKHGCIRREDTCLDELRDELVAGANDPRPRTSTLERDELAEQVLFAAMAGAPAEAMVDSVDRLLAVQREDGSFASGAPDEDPWWAIHATLASTWALSDWLAARLPAER